MKRSILAMLALTALSSSATSALAADEMRTVLLCRLPHVVDAGIGVSINQGGFWFHTSAVVHQFFLARSNDTHYPIVQSRAVNGPADSVVAREYTAPAQDGKNFDLTVDTTRVDENGRYRAVLDFNGQRYEMICARPSLR